MTTPLTEPEPQTEIPEGGESKPAYGDTVTPGYLLDPSVTPEEVHRYLQEEWVFQTPLYTHRICAAEVNARRRMGEGNLWVEKVQDRGLYRIYQSHGPSYVNTFYRKADRLCFKALSHQYQDPAQPDATPATGEPADRDAADLATRILTDLASEANLNEVEGHKQGWNLACNWGSAYLWYYTDPKGGGRQPIEVLAQPDQQHVEDALAVPGTEVRYVLPDGSLQPQSNGAALRWMPKLIRQVATPGHVRLLPHTACDLWDATGLIYRDYYPWYVLKAWFPGLQETTPEDREHAITIRPPDTTHLLPKLGWRTHDQKPKPGHEDEGLALLTIKYCLEGDQYPDGAMIVVVGDRLLPHRGPWILEVEGRREARDLPFTQIQQWPSSDGCPAGQGLMDYLGPNNETRADLYDQFERMVENLVNRKIFLPSHSTLQPKDFDSVYRKVHYITPGGQPFYEDVPEVPGSLLTMLDRTDTEMNDAANLPGESGEGLQAPNVKSGRQALTVVATQQANQSDVVQRGNRAFQRSWRVILQEAKAHFTVPQALKYSGADGSYKVKRWRGADLGSTRDITIKRGTGTTFNPLQKAQMAAELGRLAGMDQDQVQELVASGLSPFTSIQDNPILQRIRGQIAEFEDGPPPDWQPPPAPVDALGQPLLDPMTGQPVPPPPDPVVSQLWEPVLADLAPANANLRVRELNRAMCRAIYRSKPPEWQQGLLGEYQRMTQAVQPTPMPMQAPEMGLEGEPQEPLGPEGTPQPQGQEQSVLNPAS